MSLLSTFSFVFGVIFGVFAKACKRLLEVVFGVWTRAHDGCLQFDSFILVAQYSQQSHKGIVAGTVAPNLMRLMDSFCALPNGEFLSGREGTSEMRDAPWGSSLALESTRVGSLL